MSFNQYQTVQITDLMVKEQIISPISIDLGAKNTGVYFAHYKAGGSIEDIEKEGKVYQLERDSYTLLMTNRTARRHQRRGYDRRQMVKRLFKLIWEEHFGLEWDKDVQQTTSFLFNRRGFSFLTEEYDAEILRRFPKEAYQALPKELQINVNELGEYDFTGALTEWANEGEGKTKSMFDAINEEPKRIRNRLVFITKTKKLREYCDKRRGGNEIQPENKKNLENLSRWVWDEWQNSRVYGLDETFVAKDQSNGSEIEWKKPTSFNLVIYLNQQSPEVASQILNSLPDISSEKELKASIWNFKGEDFKLEEKDFTLPDSLEENATKREKDDYQKAVVEWKRLHLQHLTFALHKTLNELQSGGRHRSKYFKEIEDVLENKRLKGAKKDGKPISDNYVDRFCKKLSDGDYEPIREVVELSRLISHMSNLELKPLCKYFNDEEHKNEDCWDENRLKEIFGRWIMSEWRINPEKDKDKAVGKKGDYQKLCKDWKTHGGGVVDFWLETNPFHTIPPYQDNNNRRPPRCQSLILNPAYLDKRYPAWQMWLSELKEMPCVIGYLRNFENELQGLESGRGKKYFGDVATGKLKTDSGLRVRKDLDAHILQFIFDRVKADDPLKLNEIYSHAKKIKQNQHKSDTDSAQAVEKARRELETAISKSALPDPLKDYQKSAVYEQGTFLHLICKYYKIRQRSRDGRIFIHPEYRYVKDRGYENTRRFDDKNQLLTYCNHKPRQKRYQMLGDLAGLLQIAPVKLRAFVEDQDGKTADEKLFNWLKDIDTLQTNCDKAAKQQKARRGSLKPDIQKVYGLIDYRRQRESPSKRKIKEILEGSRVDEAYELHGVCERAKSLCLSVTQSLYNSSKQQQWQRDLENNPAAAVYLLAQINNLAFKERSGNANTCAVCSADNAQRMQMITSETIEESHAKAQRLPAIDTRLIDGAVMRMARIVGGAIASDKWEKIKGELIAEKHVRVPIITESNRFEFEPSLKEIKGKGLSNAEKDGRSAGQQKLAASKRDRIREAGGEFCPYTDVSLKGTGDKDHIIPRSSEWGTLNDEANLIWASEEGNKEVKGDNVFSLAHLKPNYKQTQFGTSNDQEIEDWIEEKIGNDEGEHFKFGPYRSFINLTPDQQTAFRHALFLVGNPLREKVISAIDNRTRTLVNGTQRYFAQVLADSLYKKAKAIKKHGLLSFDFFGVEAQDNTRGDGIHDLRVDYEKANHEISKYSKQDEEKQHPYSHIIDAQLAFAITADSHKNDGGLLLRIDDSYNLWPVNRDTGEILDKTILHAILVKPDDEQIKRLERNKPDQTTFTHRSIHRDGIYAERYLPILVHKKTSEVRIGFDWSNSFELKDTKLNRKKLYFALQFNQQGINPRLTKDNSIEELKEYLSIAGFSSKTKYFYISLSVQAIHSYYVKHYNTSKGYQQYSDEMKFLRSLSYRTEKKKITTLKEAENILKDQKNFQAGKPKLTLPVKKAWERLVDEWEKSTLADDAFLKQFFREPGSKQPHEKVRKVFSLPVKTGEGKILLKRNSWNGKDTFQIVNDSDSRKVDTKAFIPVFVNSKRKIGRLLSESAKSERVFLLSEDKNEQYYYRIDDDIKVIDPKAWYCIKLNDDLPKWGIKKLEFCIDNNTRPQVRLTLNNKPKQDEIEKIVDHPLLKPKEKEKLKTRLQEGTEENTIIEYTGSGFQQGIYDKLLPVLEAYYR